MKRKYTKLWSRSLALALAAAVAVTAAPVNAIAATTPTETVEAAAEENAAEATDSAAEETSAETTDTVSETDTISEDTASEGADAESTTESATASDDTVSEATDPTEEAAAPTDETATTTEDSKEENTDTASDDTVSEATDPTEEAAAPTDESAATPADSTTESATEEETAPTDEITVVSVLHNDEESLVGTYGTPAKPAQLQYIPVEEGVYVPDCDKEIVFEPVTGAWKYELRLVDDKDRAYGNISTEDKLEVISYDDYKAIYDEYYKDYSYLTRINYTKSISITKDEVDYTYYVENTDRYDTFRYMTKKADGTVLTAEEYSIEELTQDVFFNVTKVTYFSRAFDYYDVTLSDGSEWVYCYRAVAKRYIKLTENQSYASYIPKMGVDNIDRVIIKASIITSRDLYAIDEEKKTYLKDEKDQMIPALLAGETYYIQVRAVNCVIDESTGTILEKNYGEWSDKLAYSVAGPTSEIEDLKYISDSAYATTSFVDRAEDYYYTAMDIDGGAYFTATVSTQTQTLKAIVDINPDPADKTKKDDTFQATLERETDTSELGYRWKLTIPDTILKKYAGQKATISVYDPTKAIVVDKEGAIVTSNEVSFLLPNLKYIDTQVSPSNVSGLHIREEDSREDVSNYYYFTVDENLKTSDYVRVRYTSDEEYWETLVARYLVEDDNQGGKNIASISKNALTQDVEYTFEAVAYNYSYDVIYKNGMTAEQLDKFYEDMEKLITSYTEEETRTHYVITNSRDEEDSTLYSIGENNYYYGYYVVRTTRYGAASTTTVTRASALTAISNLKVAEKTTTAVKLSYTGVLTTDEYLELQFSTDNTFSVASEKSVDGKTSRLMTQTIPEKFAGGDTVTLTYDYFSAYGPGTYYVRARVAKRDNGNDKLEDNYRYGAYTAAVKVTISAQKPSVSVFDVQATSLSLRMSTANNLYTRYEIQQKDAKTGYKKATTLKTTDTNYTFTDLTADTTYTFRVRGVYVNKFTNKTTTTGWTSVSASTWGGDLKVLATPVSTTSVKITWSKITGAEGYTLYRRVTSANTSNLAYNGSTTDFSKYEQIKDIKTSKKMTTACTVKKLAAGETYEFVVRAYKTINGKTTYIDDGDTVTLAVTSGITITNQTQNANGKVKVTWKKVAGAKNYNVQKWNYKTLAWENYKTLKATETSVTFAKAAGNADHSICYDQYRIAAYSGSTYSEYTTITVYPYLAAPTGVTVTTQKDGGVKISWNEVAGASYYRVYRTTSSVSNYNSAMKYYTHVGGKAIVPYVKDSSSVSGYSAASYKVNQVLEVNANNYTTETTIFDAPATYTQADKTLAELNADAPAMGVTYYYYVVAYTDIPENVTRGNANDITGKASALSKAVLLYDSKVKTPTIKSVTNKSGKTTVKFTATTGAIRYEIYASAKKKGTYALIGTVTKGTTFKYKTKKKMFYKVRAVLENEAGVEYYTALSKTTSAAM